MTQRCGLWVHVSKDFATPQQGGGRAVLFDLDSALSVFVGRAVTTAGQSLAARAVVHIVVVVAVLAFLTRPGSPGARGIAAVIGGIADLVAGAVT